MIAGFVYRWTALWSRTAGNVPVWIAANAAAAPARRQALVAAGCRILATETDCGATALPELLDDLAAQGIATLMVEGGATVANSFLQEELVDRLALFKGLSAIGSEGRGCST